MTCGLRVIVDLLVSHVGVPRVSLGNHSNLERKLLVSVGAELGHFCLIPEVDRPRAVATALKIIALY